VCSSDLGKQLVQVGGAIVVGVAIYAGLAVVLRLDEFRPLMRMIVGRFGRPKEASP